MDDLLREPNGLGGRVVVRDAEQYEQSPPDRADDFVRDGDFGPSDALDDGPHGVD